MKLTNFKKIVIEAIEQAEIDNASFDAAVAEANANAALPHSVVLPRYKSAYKARAVQAGKTAKADMRCNGDWLAATLAKLVLRPVVDIDEVTGQRATKLMLDVDTFDAILDANGLVKHRTWNRTTKGWQGRLRMSGSMMLRSAVARTHEFRMPDGSVIAPPAEFIGKYE